jgi:ABC-type bacteriocin/lantibiotic exporter with double-glycine peptidase domain
MIGSMVNGGRAPTGMGCLGAIIGTVVLIVVVVLVFVVGFVALGVFAALVVMGVLALAVDRVLLALSPKRRERRASRQQAFVWTFGQLQTPDVIDATAVDMTEDWDGEEPDGRHPDDPGPE